ncbi:MAG: hypothetical protein ACLU3I_08505 [Acutalibacteraceae bacterium]
MTKHPSYRARDQPESGSASQRRKDKIMHKFEKRDAKSRALVILAVVGLAAALTLGIFTAVRLIRKPAQSKDDPRTGIIYDDSAIEGGWDNLSPEEIAEKLNEKVAEGMINISTNTAPYFEDGAADGNLMIVNESINNYPQKVQIVRNDTGEQIYESGAIAVGSKIERAKLDTTLPAGTYECTAYFPQPEPGNRRNHRDGRGNHQYYH